MLDLSTLAGAASLLGVASHLGWFIKGEHDFSSIRYLLLWSASQALGFYTLNKLVGLPIMKAMATVMVASSAYLGALFTSMTIYRLFFHKLRNFPGPLSWKLSKLTSVVKNADSQGYKHLDQLHRKYGKFVRMGPNQLSIVDPSAPQIVLGPGSKCGKALWYDIQLPLTSLHQCRDRKTHDIRRRVWDKGFNAKSLRDYESRVSKYADLLLDQIKAFGGGPFNASKWFNYYSFDVMGDLAFGESFHMLETGEKHFAIPLLEAGMDPMNIIPCAPWLSYIIAAIPILSRDYWEFIRWSGEQAEKRKDTKVNEPDIMSHLLDAPPMSDSPLVEKSWLVGDARLVIVAGSDTTAATLTYCIYELIKNPKALVTLRQEIKPLLDEGRADNTTLPHCKHLNAIIDEALRLHPPVPSGLIRTTPPEGITIGDTYIPGDTNIQIPLYTVQRSKEAYEKPHEFIPERWYSQPELVKIKGCWAPFSLGAYGCVGKNLAYMEMRTVLTRLVMEYDFAFAPGEDGSHFIEKTGDHFTLSLADLNITCKPRKS